MRTAADRCGEGGALKPLWLRAVVGIRVSRRPVSMSRLGRFKSLFPLHLAVKAPGPPGVFFVPSPGVVPFSTSSGRTCSPGRFRLARDVRLHAASTESGDGRGRLRTGEEEEGAGDRCGLSICRGMGASRCRRIPPQPPRFRIGLISRRGASRDFTRCHHLETWQSGCSPRPECGEPGADPGSRRANPSRGRSRGTGDAAAGTVSRHASG